MEGEGCGEKLMGVGSEKVHCLTFALTLTIDMLMYPAD
jgi:hypothetical protein